MKKKSTKIVILAVVILLVVTFSVFKATERTRDINKTVAYLQQKAGTDEEQFADIVYEKLDGIYDQVVGDSGNKMYDIVTGNVDASQDTVEAVAATPEIVVPEGDNPVATVTTNMGVMEFELFANDAPQSVYNFIELATSGFYDGTSIFRNECPTDTYGGVLQGGSSTNDASGSLDYAIQGEFSDNGIANPNEHVRGSLAMARSSDMDSAGSQFFIDMGDNAMWNAGYAVFGQLTSGDDVLTKMEDVCSTESMGAPSEEITVESVTIDTKGIEYPAPTKL